MGVTLKDVRVGDSVWTLERANGVVDYIDYEAGTADVNHYDNGRKTYDFDIFYGNWDDQLNQWVIS